ncbi:MAG: phospho-N-acetylmuramoyl-pentapeptide-transferase [Bacteroidales bacterium]|nr:phospho-N-acetylmuramoyl-pentapeptide-transferase [Bacteroidales bacterium]
MLYYLFNYLDQHDFPGAGVFNYVTFRAATAIILALVISVWFGNWFIKMLKRKKVVETQRDATTDPYNTQKKGVPTMGGVIIIAAILIPVLLVCKLHSVYTILMIVTTLILGILGFADDYIKTFKHNKDGLKPKVKLGGQILLGLIVGLTLRFSPAVQINETVQLKIEDNKEVVVKSPDVKSTRTTIPFVKNHNLNYADLFKWAGPKWMYNLAWVFLVLLTVFVVAAVSNGSNLNDGMDGMASGNSAIIGLTLVILAYISSNAVTASHFNLMYIPGSEELVVFMAAFVGSLIGFLWFNSFPAQIFMGDTGSLTIGGLIAVSAIIMHKELLLPLLCGVFLLEILSDLDVKLFLKRGKRHRIWKKGPVHDHFRTSYSDFKKAWPNSTVTFKGHGEGYNTVHHEVKITIRFWIITILLAAFTLITFKIR